MEHECGWQILKRCQEEADGPAWTAFIERFEPVLRWGIRRTLAGLGFDGDRREFAADLLQECYCKILSGERRVLRLCRERDERAIDAFLARLAERCTRDSLRAVWTQKRGRRALVDLSCDLEDLPIVGSEPSPEDSALMKEARSKLLETCRRAAGVRQRERDTRVLAMAFLEGLSSREIARRFAGRLSLTCIDSVVYRARRRLRREGVVLRQRRAVA